MNDDKNYIQLIYRLIVTVLLFAFLTIIWPYISSVVTMLIFAFLFTTILLPLVDQLDSKICDYVYEQGFKQSIECSGIKQPPSSVDWVVLSPKIAEHAILKKWVLRNEVHCDELRWVRHKGQSIPNTKIKAHTYYLSPHSDGYSINNDNLKHCIELCLKNPKWKLSTQDHKIWSVL